MEAIPLSVRFDMEKQQFSAPSGGPSHAGCEMRETRRARTIRKEKTPGFSMKEKAGV